MTEQMVQFTKYTSFGNTFLMVDETVRPLACDADRAEFARWALNGDFGVGGADNVLYLSRAESTSEQLFRIFEIDGSETLSCGNGLLSTAAYLHGRDGARSWVVQTELPSGTAKPVSVGVADAGRTWVDVGQPRAVSTALYRRDGAAPDDHIDQVEDLTVPVPPDGPWGPGVPEKVTLSGMLVFTGEPHLILFSGSGYPAELEPHLFLATHDVAGAGVGLPPTPAMRRSLALVDHLGHTVNEQYRHLFPQGVHLNFARVLDPAGRIEYRTWERAINRETLACGSGSVAMAYIARQRGLVTGDHLEFWPHRCRWYQPSAALGVRRSSAGFVLFGEPRLVCTGEIPWRSGGRR